MIYLVAIPYLSISHCKWWWYTRPMARRLQVLKARRKKPLEANSAAGGLHPGGFWPAVWRKSATMHQRQGSDGMRADCRFVTEGRGQHLKKPGNYVGRLRCSRGLEPYSWTSCCSAEKQKQPESQRLRPLSVRSTVLVKRDRSGVRARLWLRARRCARGIPEQWCGICKVWASHT